VGYFLFIYLLLPTTFPAFFSIKLLINPTRPIHKTITYYYQIIYTLFESYLGTKLEIRKLEKKWKRTRYNFQQKKEERRN